MKRTTKEQFEFFKDRTKFYCRKLAPEYKVYFEHTNIGEAYSTCSYHFDGFVATMKFNTILHEPMNDEVINTSAFHEACHLALSPLVWKASHMYSLEFLNLIEEQVVRKFEHFFEDCIN